MRPLGKLLRRSAVIATNSVQRDRFLRGRFLALAARYTPVVAVDDHRGNRYFLDPADAQVGRSLFTIGSFDLEKMDRAVRELADVEVTQVMDIGANIGTSTIELLSRYPEATGVAFEPDPKNFKLLSHNVAANDLGSRVAAHEIALSNSDGEMLLEISHDNLGDHRIRLGPPEPGVYGEHSRATRPVQARRLDTLIERGEVAVDSETLVYMDAQGHEGQILEGASLLVAAGCPVVLEFWPYGLRRADGHDRLIDIMAGYGRIVNLDDPGATLRMSNIGRLSDGLGETGHVDLLLIP